MDKFLWKILMWIWVRQATKRFGGPGQMGAMFRTADFQIVMKNTTGHYPVLFMANSWLEGYGYIKMPDKIHWMRARRVKK